MSAFRDRCNAPPLSPQFGGRADIGCPFFSQYSLGVMYANGQGVPQDYAEAVRWYRKAADWGVPSAQNNLGAMYANGRGVTQDSVEAHMWFNLAGEQGNKTDTNNRDIVAKRMTPTQIAEAQRRAAIWRPRR